MDLIKLDHNNHSNSSSNVTDNCFLLQARCLKYLKLIYSIVYFKLCFLIVCLHLAVHASSYHTELIADELEIGAARSVVEHRGITTALVNKNNDGNDEKSVHRLKIRLAKLIKESGRMVEAELNIPSNHLSTSSATRHFSSAGEFLESVEDSKDSVWLVHLTYPNTTTTTTDKCQSSLLSPAAWLNLTNRASQFGILAGHFNCGNDRRFCSLKGWHGPRVLLGLRTTRQNSRYSVELFSYEKCDPARIINDLLKWLELRLRTRLVHSASVSKDKPPTDADTNLQIYYIQNNNNHLPLYFTATALKYTRHGASFNFVNASHFTAVTKCSAIDPTALRTPIIFVLNSSICYNYGANLNELPSHATLNLYMLFLYPDTSKLFLVSLFFLNSFLIFMFFEYNESLVRQFLLALLYFCTVNFCLFAAWVATMSSKLENCLAWLRFALLCSEFMHGVAARVRFTLFYFVYVRPEWLLFVYITLAIVFYFHTRAISNHKQRILSTTENTHQQSQPLLHPELSTTIGTNAHSSSNIDSDTEQSVSDLISRINGPTSIWLESSTRLERMLLELPCVQLCRCLRRYLREAAKSGEVKYLRSMSSCSSFSEDDDGYDKKFEFDDVHCHCGRNPVMRKQQQQCVVMGGFGKFNRECSICLERYVAGAALVVLPCGHFFHRKCVYEWFMNSAACKCPCCRMSLSQLKKSI